LPSSQLAPGLGCKVQPVAGSQPLVVHGLVSVQSSGGPATQIPPLQVSLSVHLLLSVHGVLSCKFEWAHCWFAGLQVSAVHGLLSSQFTPMPPHFPAVHLSPMVQALPSSQGVSSILFTLEQPVIELQLSTVQSLLSLHVTGVPALQLPPWHASPWVQTSLSVQGKLSATGA
jgi:hypothetical protein